MLTVEPLRGLQPLPCSVPKLDAPTISAPESDFSDVPALEDMDARLFSFEIPDGAPEVVDGETVADFIFGGSKITADGDCSHERCLLLGRKFMTT